MSPEQGGQERSEQATPKRLAESRKKGQVAKSTDLAAAISFLGMTMVLMVSAERLIRHGAMYLALSMNRLAYVARYEGSFGALFVDGISNGATMLWPLLLAAVLIGVIANLIQVGFLASGEALKPNFGRMNPLEGLKKMFSTKALFDLVKALFKLLLVGIAAYTGVRGEISALLMAGYSEAPGALAIVGQVLLAVALRVGIVYLFIGLADFLFQKHEFKKSVMMTKQEIKEEHKQMEGDPQIKSRQRERQRMLATRQMFSDIPSATVLVTNPTHFAVALKYEPNNENAAPYVVAKGCDYLAQRIIEAAKEADVPIVRNVEVARALYKQSDIGSEIPIELYRAVAEILAEVFQEAKGGL